MNIIKLFDIFKRDGLFSRDDGKTVRNIVSRFLDKGNTVTLDFDRINWISIGWAYETIGVLAEALGVEFVKNNIKVINARHNIKTILNLAVKAGQSPKS